LYRGKLFSRKREKEKNNKSDGWLYYTGIRAFRSYFQCSYDGMVVEAGTTSRKDVLKAISL
jgi:hypothetical protein